MNDSIFKQIDYLESIISDLLDNGFSELAIKKQAELNKLYDKINEAQSKARKIKAEREFSTF